MGKLKKNLGYQTFYQILTTALPLITSPYLSRVLGASSLGVYSYTQSVVNYFTLFAMVGTFNYGTKTIAMCRSKEERTKTFWEIYSFQLALSVISLVAYFVFLSFSTKYLQVFLIQGICILGAMTDINWLFFGMQKIELTVKRSTVIKLLTLVAIFIFVKGKSDVWIYTLIMGVGTFASNFILWFFANDLINKPIKIDISGVCKHIKPNLTLFIPLLAMSLFHVMDKTMLGAMSTNEQSGFYYTVDKLVNIPIGVFTGIGMVMLPQISELRKNGEIEKAKDLFNNGVELTVVVSIALCFGLAAISKEFVPLFFGTEYTPCILLTIVMAPVFIFKGLSMIVRNLYLIPFDHDRVYIESVIIGAVVNIVFNAFAIPRIGALGAIIGTVIAEGLSFTYQYLKIQDILPFKKIISYISMYLICGCVMLLAVRFSSRVQNIYLAIICEVTTGVLTYSAAVLLIWKITNNRLLLMVKGSFRRGRLVQDRSNKKR